MLRSFKYKFHYSATWITKTGVTVLQGDEMSLGRELWVCKHNKKMGSVGYEIPQATPWSLEVIRRIFWSVLLISKVFVLQREQSFTNDIFKWNTLYLRKIINQLISSYKPISKDISDWIKKGGMKVTQSVTYPDTSEIIMRQTVESVLILFSVNTGHKEKEF